MPEGKLFIKEFLSDKYITRILDVGPGSGNYFDLLTGAGEYANYPGRNLGRDDAVEWVAVEIFEPYLNSFKLYNKYNQIYISDIYDVSWEELGKFSVIILGDVIEHMQESRGREVIKRAADHADWVIMSLPIIEYPQGISYGNVHETHIEQYSPHKVKSLLADYDIVASQEGDVIGVYIFRRGR